jgi:hypothetical protein
LNKARSFQKKNPDIFLNFTRNIHKKKCYCPSVFRTDRTKLDEAIKVPNTNLEDTSSVSPAQKTNVTDLPADLHGYNKRVITF